MHGIQVSRRSLLRGLGYASAAGAVSLPFWRSVQADPLVGPPTRLLVVHFPCGTVPEQWFPTGGTEDFVLGEITAPFEALRDRMVILGGLDIIRQSGAPGDNHGSGMVTVMSGSAPVESPDFDTPIASHPSLDQILAEQSPLFADTPIASVQLAADTRADRDDIYHRVLTYGAPLGQNPWAQPMPPQDQVDEAFSHLFGSIVLGEGGGNLDQLEAIRQRKLHVMDVLDGDLDRLAARAPSAQIAKLESHRDAIAQLRTNLEGSASAACIGQVQELEGILPGGGASHQAIGMAQLQLIKTAFMCDMTRIATFMWAAGTSHVNFSDVIEGVRDKGHHGITHSSSPKAELAMIDTWYSERMAEFLADLDATPDPFGSGSLLDNTLVVYLSEMAQGGHTFRDVPAILFGGAGGRLGGGRYLQYDGRSFNDLWLAIAEAFDHPL
ncbi:MAG: DUF1552 domain-containing protein [Myxococcota bacterium]